MFWTKRPDPAKAPDPVRETPAPKARPEEDPSAESLDALAAVLRAWGRNAFDVAELPAKQVEKTLEGWAQHVLVFAPPPGSEAPRDGAPVRRNFGMLVRALTEHRKAEREYVQTAIPELRSMVWSFVRTLARSLGSDEQADVRLRERVKRLEDAAAGDSFAVLKAEASLTASVIGEVVKQREERARLQTQELAQTLRSLREQLEEANREGSLDPLTRIYNRKTLAEVLLRSANLSTLALEPCTLMMIDIDHFKRVNDQHGHQAGDAVLKAVADALVRCFPRRADVVARFGGEEFAVVLNGASIRETAALVERPLAAIRGLAIRHGNTTLSVTASIGFATVRSGEPVEAWVERADKALYAAKQGGRDRAVAAADDAPQVVVQAAPSTASGSYPPFVRGVSAGPGQPIVPMDPSGKSAASLPPVVPGKPPSNRPR